MDCHLRWYTCVLFSGNSKSSTLSSHFSHSHLNTTVGHTITLRWSLRNHFHSYTCVNHRILECVRTRFNSMLSTNTSTFDTSSPPTPCRQHALNLHVLVCLCSLDSLDAFGLWEFLPPRVPLLLRFPFRQLHEIHPLVRCHHQLVLHLDSEFSSDLRAHCSAIPGSDW